MNIQEKVTTRSSKLKVHSKFANDFESHLIFHRHSLFFFSFFSFFCLLVWFWVFLVFFEITNVIDILIYIRLSRQTADEKKFTQLISRNKATFFGLIYIFKKEVKKWKPENHPCGLCKDYAHEVEFLTINYISP